MPYICKEFVLRIVTWSYNYLFRIIISYLELYNCVQTNDYYYQIEIIIWIHIIICIRQEYLTSYNCV